MRLNSTGLGVGVSPAYTLHAKKVLSGTSTTVNGLLYLENTGAGNSAKITLTDGVSNNGYIVYSFETGTPTLGLGVGSAQQLVVNASGNVGIGVTPSAWSGITALQISRGSFASDTGSYTLNQNVFNNGSNRYIATAAAMQFQAIPGTGFLWNIAPSGTAGNAITFTQAMTLDASGNLLVGTTASGGQNGFCVLRPLSAAVVATTTETAHNFGALTGTTYATFLYATTAIGSITQNGTTGVLYNINSDYRLKESVAPLSGGLARVNALKPSIYKWKSDGSSGEGFLAHELAEVVPAAVTGEKDAVNEDGSIKSQGIDMSRVVPILVAAIQELTARVQTLETR